MNDNDNDNGNVVWGPFVKNAANKSDKNGWDDSFDAETAKPSQIAKWFAERGYPVDRGDKILGSKNLYSPAGVRNLSREEEHDASKTFGLVFHEWCRPRLETVHSRLITARAEVRDATQSVENFVRELAQIDPQIDNPKYDSSKTSWTLVEVFLAFLWAIVCLVTLYVSSVILGDMVEVMLATPSENFAHAFWTGMTILLAATFSGKAFHMTRKTPEGRDRVLTTLIVLSGLAALIWFVLFALDYGGFGSRARGLEDHAFISQTALEALRQIVQLIGDSLLGAWTFILLVDSMMKFGWIRPPQIANPVYLQKKTVLDKARRDSASHEAFVHELESLDSTYENAREEFVSRCLDNLKKRHLEKSIPTG